MDGIFGSLDLPSFGAIQASVMGACAYVVGHSYEWWLTFWNHPLGKALLLLGGVFLIVWLIALIYSGEVQRSLSGPIEFRAPTGRPLDERVIQAPRAIIPQKLDGLWANCTFFLVYVDARGRSVHKPVYKRHMQLTVLPRRLAARPDLATLMIKDAYEGIENLTFDHVTEPDSEAVCLSGSIGDTITANAQRELRKPIDRLERIKRIPLYRMMRREGAAKRRPAPDQEATVQFRMRFHTSPWFVLSAHPDREVKTTAWLTVLTSIFALAMQLMYGTWPGTDRARGATPEPGGTQVDTTRPVTVPRPPS
ncbi:hypothetical protein [Terricaulis silvestris]|uniref:Uncharacterized protein n=1 Tax=Terricaulis silvestris TaxID=2686094 RepID=A0A6I6MJY6_9CAUL|nr:hypothetical protein [Terricaulis silvestris]QGZ95520.1 hypothetical protein DSM104635_02369 [Terricaulis silvestris]